MAKTSYSIDGLCLLGKYILKSVCWDTKFPCVANLTDKDFDRKE